MTKKWKLILIAGLIACILAMGAIPSWATQTHGEPEGLYIHQLAHLFFSFSMGLFIFWLRQRKLVKEKAWRYIQYSAMLLILWNVDTFAVHFLDEQVDIIRISQLDDWHLQIDTAADYAHLGLIYYLAKLDHLLLVPAMLCLYLGLKRLYQETLSPSEGSAS